MKTKEITSYQGNLYFITISLKLRADKKCSKKELLFLLEYIRVLIEEQEKGVEKTVKKNQRLFYIAKLLKKFDAEYLKLAQENWEDLQSEKDYLRYLKEQIKKVQDTLEEEEVIHILEDYGTMCEYQKCRMKYYNPNASLFKRFVLRKTCIINYQKREKIKNYKTNS